MKRIINTKLFLFIIFFSACLLAQDNQLQWIEFPDPLFKVSGLPSWGENKPDLFRLPKSSKNKVRKPVWNLSQSPSGGRIRFRSDCTDLSIRLEYPHKGNMKNMHTFGQCGIDLYIDNTYIKTAIPKDSTYVEFLFFDKRPKMMRNITLFLPLYSSVKIRAIGVNPEAQLEDPLPFVIEKPVVYYGSSITQGGCASHPGMSYQAIISRNLNIDFVNQGYSGNGMGEPEMAEEIAKIEAACYVLDFGVNLPDADSLQKVYGPFLKILRHHRPDTPIIAVTPIYNAPEFWEPNKATFMRDVIRKEIAELRRAGDKNILLVEGFELLGPEFADGFVDGVHPNDLGFLAMAEGLQPYIARVLNLSGRNYKLKR
jgi:lysophospholipase L1-like esterase